MLTTHFKGSTFQMASVEGVRLTMGVLDSRKTPTYEVEWDGKRLGKDGIILRKICFATT
jgi:hypothetical protein